MMRKLILAALLTFAVAACGADAKAEATSAAGATEAPAVVETEGGEAPASEAPDGAATDEPAAEAPSEAVEGPKVFKVDEPIDVTGEFISSDVRVTVTDVKQAKKYGAYSKPEKGNVYLAVKYAYEALEDGATFNPFDWQVFVDDTAISNFAFVMDGPKPALTSGTLPKGRKASGWVVYEVPKAGKVVLSYGANMFGGDAPTFEVVARAK